VRCDADRFASDFRPGLGEETVDRTKLLKTLRAYVDHTGLDIEWQHFETATNEALVDGLAMMSPCGAREKQALLEAPDLASRAELLVAITERSIGQAEGGGTTPLQ